MSAAGPRTLLVICPAYASHLNPLLAIAASWQSRVGPVVIATGSVLEPLVTASGCGFRELVLGPGNNPGVMRPDEQPTGEDEHMQAFFAATREGALATLEYQARARGHDMLYRPDEVYVRLNAILADIRPDRVLVDQLSYGATLAMHALGRPFASFLPAAPASLPGVGEFFGLPRTFPTCLSIDPSRLARLATLCRATDRDFTANFNQCLGLLNPYAAAVESAFRWSSPWLTMVNYPKALNNPAGRSWPCSVQFIGSTVREEPPDPNFESRLADLAPGLPTVYVSFGTFLSARDDVLGYIIDTLRDLPVNVILAYGSSNGLVTRLPDRWVAQDTVPQIRALQRADLAISHGGNNTVTEALTLGVPLLIGPFSSDQFDGAAAVESAGYGGAFDPNHIVPAEFAGQIQQLLASAAIRARVQTLGQALRRYPGQDRAVDLLLDRLKPTETPVDAGCAHAG